MAKRSNPDAGIPPVTLSVDAIERRRRMKPILAAIVLILSIALALVIAHFWSASAPYPYAM